MPLPIPFGNCLGPILPALEVAMKAAERRQRRIYFFMGRKLSTVLVLREWQVISGMGVVRDDFPR